MKKSTIKVDEHTQIETNEFGNVSKVEITEVFAEKQGELEETFYYRIEKEANLSTDEEAGESFPVYCQVTFNYENEMDAETLLYAHHVHYRRKIAIENDINIDHITPISKEEYETK